MLKNKIIWVDAIKVFAIMLVVLQHVVTPLIYSYEKIKISDWWLANFYHSISDVCVPLLLMISGYLLLNSDKPIKYFIKHRIIKVLIPLIAWTLIYLFWNHYYTHKIDLSFYSLFQTLIKPAQYHLWFLYTILGLYLLMPILNVFIKNSSSLLQYYFIFLWFLSVSFFPLLQKITNTYPDNEDLSIFSGYLGYLLLGYVLGKKEFNKKYFPLLIITVIFLLTFSTIATYYLTQMNGNELNKYFHSYLSPNVIILSSLTFILIKIIFKNTSQTCNKDYKILNSFGVTTFGIYLIHVITLNLLKNGDLGFTFSSFTLIPIIGIPLLTLIIFLLSYILILILQEIPFIRKCVP